MANPRRCFCFDRACSGFLTPHYVPINGSERWARRRHRSCSRIVSPCLVPRAFTTSRTDSRKASLEAACSCCLACTLPSDTYTGILLFQRAAGVRFANGKVEEMLWPLGGGSALIDDRSRLDFARCMLILFVRAPQHACTRAEMRGSAGADGAVGQRHGARLVGRYAKLERRSSTHVNAYVIMTRICFRLGPIRP